MNLTTPVSGEQFANQADEQPAEAVYNKLDPRYIPVQRIAGLIFATCIFVTACVVLTILFIAKGLNIGLMIAAPCAMLLCLILFVMAIVWPPISYRHIRWRLTTTGLEIRRGVIWRHQITIPIARVQHADVSQGPLQRQYDLGTLTVHTAGTQNASIEMDGLTHQIAVWLRDEIIRQRKASDVV